MKKNYLIKIVCIFMFALTILNYKLCILHIKAMDENIIKSISIDKNIIHSGELVNIGVEFNSVDVDVDVNTIYLTYFNMDFNAEVEKTITLTLSGNSFFGSIQLADDDVKGNWKLRTISYGDKTIYNSEMFSSDNLILSDLRNGDFILESTNESQISINYLNIDKKTVKNGDEINLIVGVSTNKLELQEYAIVEYVSPSNISRQITLSLNRDKYEGTIPVGKYDENGNSRIRRIIIYANDGTSFYIYNSNLNYSGATDLSLADFEIIENIDGVSPRLLSIELDKTKVSTNQSVNIVVNAVDYISNLSNYSYICYRKPDGTTRYIDLNLTNGRYEGIINIVNDKDIGKWNIEFIAIRNNSGYEAITYIGSSETNNAILKDGEFTALRNCDLDNDTIVSIKDLAELGKLYNRRNTDFNWIEKYDINFDNIIDIYDMVLLSKKLQR